MAFTVFADSLPLLFFTWPRPPTQSRAHPIQRHAHPRRQKTHTNTKKTSNSDGVHGSFFQLNFFSFLQLATPTHPKPRPRRKKTTQTKKTSNSDGSFWFLPTFFHFLTWSRPPTQSRAHPIQRHAHPRRQKTHTNTKKTSNSDGVHGFFFNFISFLQLATPTHPNSKATPTPQNKQHRRRRRAIQMAVLVSNFLSFFLWIFFGFLFCFGSHFFRFSSQFRIFFSQATPSSLFAHLFLTFLNEL